VKPPRLTPGATIGIAALSGRVEPGRLDRGLAHLKSRGFSIREAANLRLSHGDFAGSDEERAAGYRALLVDPGVEAIFFARGGWGASRTLDRLDPAEIVANPKIHLGGSDLTSFFAFLDRRCGLVSFLGPMVAVDFARDPIDEETDSSWEEVLSGRAAKEFAIGPGCVIASGRGVGPLAGGCLSLLVALEGTPEAVETEGRVIFWEDVNEEIYRLDRMLTQLERAGRWQRPAGVIIGALEGISRNRRPDPEALSALLAEHFRVAPFPVICGWPAGHGITNRTLPLGAAVSIDTERGSVTFEEAGVR
jgi:muramoyltetrapeptide carboxypeptidase